MPSPPQRERLIALQLHLQAIARALTPLTPHLGAEVFDVDLRSPSPELARAIEQAMDRYAVLVFRNQQLDQDQQIAFARSLGPLDLGFAKVRNAPHRFKYSELADISNVDVNGEVVAREHTKIVGNIANQLWHSDSSFQKPRAKYSMLHAVVIPEHGGDTEFADLRAAYDALPDELRRRIDGLQAEHYALHSRLSLGDTSYTEEQRARIPAVHWPIVQTHAGSGRKLIYVGAHCRAVPGLTVPEGRILLMDLLEHATQREFVYRHRWQVGDLVIWDNTATVHRGRHFELSERREMRRSTTEEVRLGPK